MPNVRESVYHHFYQGQDHPLVIRWEDEKDESGLYPVVNVSGQMLPTSHFYYEVLSGTAARKRFNEFLENESKHI